MKKKAFEDDSICLFIEVRNLKFRLLNLDPDLATEMNTDPADPDL